MVARRLLLFAAVVAANVACATVLRTRSAIVTGGAELGRAVIGKSNVYCNANVSEDPEQESAVITHVNSNEFCIFPEASFLSSVLLFGTASSFLFRTNS